jgi:type IV secretory pathway TraG/TraD family ATPase VirD4
VTRLLILAFLPALAFGQSEYNARADGEMAANWQHVIDVREAEYRKGAISREKLNKDKAQAEATIARLRKNNADDPVLKAAFEKEYIIRVRMWRGQTDWGEVARSVWTSLKNLAPLYGSLFRVLFWFLVSTAGVLVIFWLFKAVADAIAEQAAQKGQPPPLSDNYGTASFAPFTTDDPSYEAIHHGVFFGQSGTPENPFARGGAPIFSRPGHHTLICGKTGVGKGVRIIIPTLATYQDSILTIDPKGENAAVTARHRRDVLGQTVHVLNPWNELSNTFRRLGFTAATYNPLDILDRQDPNAVAVAQSIANAICPPSLGEKDPYWTASASSILTAVLLWLADQPGEKKTLARARQITSKTRKEFTDKFLVGMAASEAFDGALSDARVKETTASSSFSMTDLALRPSTVFLIVPFDRLKTHRTWLRLLIIAGMTAMKQTPASRRQGRCMFLIDELPALGYIPELPGDLATMRGFGCDFTLTIQGLDQLKAQYGDEQNAIVSNCGYKWFSGVNDLPTAEYLSKTLGKKTVRTVGKTEGRSDSDGRSGARGTDSQSTTYGETGRELLSPDEIQALGSSAAILLAPNSRPHYPGSARAGASPTATESRGTPSAPAGRGTGGPQKGPRRAPGQGGPEVGRPTRPRVTATGIRPLP